MVNGKVFLVNNKTSTTTFNRTGCWVEANNIQIIGFTNLADSYRLGFYTICLFLLSNSNLTRFLQVVHKDF